jgi:hypothetical protein
MIVEDKVTARILTEYPQKCEVEKAILYFHLLNPFLDIHEKPNFLNTLHIILAFIRNLTFNIVLLRNREKSHRIIVLEKPKHRQFDFMRNYQPAYVTMLRYCILFLIKILRQMKTLLRSHDILQLTKQLNYIAADCLHEKNVIIVEGDTPLQKAILITRKPSERVTLIQWGSLTNSCVKYPFRNFLGVSIFISSDKTFIHAIDDGQIKVTDKCKFLKISHDKNINSRSLKVNTAIIIDQSVGGFISHQINDHFYADLKMLSGRFPELQFFVRPHPENKNRSFPLDTSDGSALIKSDVTKAQVAISIASSGLLNALHQGVIPVSYFPCAIDYKLSLDLSTELFSCHPLGIIQLELLVEKLANASEAELRTHLNIIYERYF